MRRVVLVKIVVKVVFVADHPPWRSGALHRGQHDQHDERKHHEYAQND
ncbi:hypothetical protein SDC9_159758 [bioreactor metagenome]|uniref:Uncharacterized protein n=1 Tax=bioreactor metagenome TaxID=1076179 RepID=A0A645FEP8_9ZZZZ